MTANDFISKKENDTGLLFEKWSLTQLCTYMDEYAELVNSSNVIRDVIEKNYTQEQVDILKQISYKEGFEDGANEACNG